MNLKIQKNSKRMIVKISNQTSMEIKSRLTKLEANEHLTKPNLAKEPNNDFRNQEL
jgi:hypothetical protein